MNDLISRQAAINEITEYGSGYAIYMSVGELKRRIEHLPSAQPERLTDDDFETIRIHLSAYKEGLCNQHRWKEAEEYQRIIDRFMGFASAQPEIIRCKDCKYASPNGKYGCKAYHFKLYETHEMEADDFCSRAERRTDEEVKHI